MLKLLIFVAGLLMSGTLAAKTKSKFRLIDVTALDLEYLRLDPDNRDAYAPQYTGYWREQAALVFNISVLRYIYWHNRVHTETVNPSRSVKGVGWEWELGIKLSKYADIFSYHHSKHIMEEQPDRLFDNRTNQFPVENAYGLRIKLLNFR